MGPPPCRWEKLYTGCRNWAIDCSQENGHKQRSISPPHAKLVFASRRCRPANLDCSTLTSGWLKGITCTRCVTGMGRDKAISTFTLFALHQHQHITESLINILKTTISNHGFMSRAPKSKQFHERQFKTRGRILEVSFIMTDILQRGRQRGRQPRRSISYSEIRSSNHVLVVYRTPDLMSLWPRGSIHNLSYRGQSPVSNQEASSAVYEQRSRDCLVSRIILRSVRGLQVDNHA